MVEQNPDGAAIIIDISIVSVIIIVIIIIVITIAFLNRSQLPAICARASRRGLCSTVSLHDSAGASRRGLCSTALLQDDAGCAALRLHSLAACIP